MKISGSVGYTLLQKNNKYVLLLADVHDGVKYCEQDSIMIDKFLNVKDDNNILLEEVLREKFTLTDLWPGSSHTQRLKKLNVNNKKIKPIDIRPMLLPFSWELIGMNKINQDVTLKEYLVLLDNFFNYKSTRFINYYIVPEMKKTFNMKDLIIKHFHILKDKYNEFKKNNIKYMDTKILDLYKNNSNILETLNDIASSIMEWYIVMLVHNSIKNTIIHVGLAHSEKVLILLTGPYHFNIVESQGVNNMENLRDTMRACIIVPQEINNLFPNGNLFNRKNYF
jgi:hypothetical protein